MATNTERDEKLNSARLTLALACVADAPTEHVQLEKWTRKLTKAQAIKRLTLLGVTDITQSGKYLINATIDGYEGLFDPREMLAELIFKLRWTLNEAYSSSKVVS